VREVLRLGADLRPAWWVLRGYLLVLVPSVARVDAFDDFPVPSPLGLPQLGLLLVVVSVVGSVALGRRALPRALRVLVAVAGVVLLGAGAAAADRADDRLSGDPVAGPAFPERALGEQPLLSRYGPVTDVLPYAADGTPLEGVLLYDQDGRPLQVGFQEWWADECVRGLDQPVAADGVPVPHSFPQRYQLRGLDVDIHGAPLRSGQCEEELPRPDVELPVFAAGRAAG
jgi:hypothetical protein